MKLNSALFLSIICIDCRNYTRYAKIFIFDTTIFDTPRL